MSVIESESRTQVSDYFDWLLPAEQNPLRNQDYFYVVTRTGDYQGDIKHMLTEGVAIKFGWSFGNLINFSPPTLVLFP